MSILPCTCNWGLFYRSKVAIRHVIVLSNYVYGIWLIRFDMERCHYFQVASRHVFVGVGILYILFGIFGKFSAIFITIPYPVLGGAIVVMFGIFFGVVISNLEVIFVL